MQFEILIDSENEAVNRDEVPNILRKIAHAVEQGYGNYGKFESILDYNGNRIGSWRLKA